MLVRSLTVCSVRKGVFKIFILNWLFSYLASRIFVEAPPLKSKKDKENRSVSRKLTIHKVAFSILKASLWSYFKQRLTSTSPSLFCTYHHIEGEIYGRYCYTKNWICIKTKNSGQANLLNIPCHPVTFHYPSLDHPLKVIRANLTLPP